jgi:steroid delta-isomerase-like uncharacterized protein
MGAVAVTQLAGPPAPPDVRQTAVALLDAWNSHDLSRITALYAPDYEGTDVGWPSPRHGPEQVCRGWQRYLAAFPDLQFSLDEIVADDEHVAIGWTASGTHEGLLMNIPPTRRRITVRGASLCRFVNGQLKRAVHVWDVAGLLRTIGLLPDL